MVPVSSGEVRPARAGRVRRGGLAVVMVGALAVSVRGQVEAVTPLLGGMAIVLALTNDLAAFLALNEVLGTRRRDVRRWAWAVLLLAGGTAAGLNTWHALDAAVLPALWAVVVGIGPVVLAMLLSHLVALVLNDDDARADSAAPPARTAPAPREPSASTVGPADRPAVETARAGQVSAALIGPGTHPALAVVPTRPQPRPRAGAEDPRVERLSVQLRAGAELTGSAVAEQLGCSERTGRRLLRQAAGHDEAADQRQRGTG